MEVAQFGPRELRVVKEETWSLPVHCEPYSSDGRTITHWSVRPAVPLLAAPFSELSKRFGQWNCSESTTFWVIEEKHLDTLTIKVDGCDAKYYLNWGSQTPGKEMVGREIIEPDEKDDQFIKFCCDKACIDYPLGRYVWRAIKNGMQHWLINTQKPIPFELFTLFPIPYRQNWKEIMLSKHNTCYQVFRRNRKKWTRSLVDSGFIEDLGSVDLLSMNQNRTFNWTLEAVPSPLWVKSVREAEIKRLATKSPIKYACYYESCIKRRLDDILTTFGAWVSAIRNPVGSLRESLSGSGNILVPSAKTKTVAPSRYRPLSTTFQASDGSVRLIPGQSRRPRHLSKTLRKMFELSNIPPQIGDVREHEEHGHVGGGASGVLLQNENESNVEGQRLLVEGEGVK